MHFLVERSACILRQAMLILHPRPRHTPFGLLSVSDQDQNLRDFTETSERLPLPSSFSRVLRSLPEVLVTPRCLRPRSARRPKGKSLGGRPIASVAGFLLVALFAPASEFSLSFSFPFPLPLPFLFPVPLPFHSLLRRRRALRVLRASPCSSRSRTVCLQAQTQKLQTLHFGAALVSLPLSLCLYLYVRCQGPEGCREGVRPRREKSMK